MKTQIQLFICNHKRDGDEDCAGKGAKELTDQLKKWAKEHHGQEIKVYRSGCLSKCSEGIAMASYPDKKLWTEVSPADVEEIKKDLSIKL